MNVAELFSESAAPLAVINPASYNSEQNTTLVNVAKYHRIAIVLHAGAIGTSINADVEIATDSGGTALHTLKSITAMTSADPNELVVIEIDPAELTNPTGASGQNYDWLRLEVTPVGSCLFSAIVFGLVGRFHPEASSNWDEVVN